MLNLFRSTMVRNAGKLLSANVIAQVIGILVYPVLTRMYAPEDFALLNLFMSISGVLTLIATAEYQYAIVLPKAEEHARALTHVCLLLLSAMTLLTCLSLPFAGAIAGLFKAPELANWWWLMPLSVFCLGLWNILNYWYIRRRAFTRISGYQITQSGFSASGKIGFGWLGRLQGGMIVASVFALLLSMLINGALAWRNYLRELLHPNRSDMRAVSYEYANFPKFNLPRALVNSVGISLPVWLLTPHFGLSEVGQLSLAMMAAFVPLSIISRACYQVLYQRVAELVQNRLSVSRVLWRFCLWIAGALVVGLIPVFVFMPQLVTFIFGAEWLESAYIIRALYPFIVLTPVCGSICFLSDVFAKQKTALWMEIGYVAALALALVAGIHTGDFLSAIALFAWVRFAYLAIQLVWYIFLVRNYNRTLS